MYNNFITGQFKPVVLLLLFSFKIVFSSFAITYKIIDSLIIKSINNGEYKKALELIESNEKPDGEKQDKNLFLLSEIYIKLGEIDKLNKTLGQIDALNSAKNENYQFNYRLLKGRYYSLLEKDNDALKWLSNAEILIANKKNKEIKNLGTLHGELGLLYLRKEKYDLAIKYLELSLTEISDQNLLNGYRSCLAKAYWYKNDTDKAKKLINICLNYLKRIKEPTHPSLINLYINLSDYLTFFDRDFETVHKFLQASTIILNKHYPHDHYLYSIIYTYKSYEKYAEKDFENTINYSNQALTLSIKYPFLFRYNIINYKLLASTYYWYKQDYDKTIYYCNNVIANLERTEKPPDYFYYLLGLSYNKLKKIEFAKSYFNKAISFYTGSSSYKNPNYSIILINLAKIASKEKHPDLALNYLKKALEISKKQNNKNISIQNIYYEIGKIYYFYSSDYLKALQHVQKSILSGCRTFSDTAIFSNPSIKDVILTYQLIESFSLKAYLFYMLYKKHDEDLNYLKAALNCQEISVKLYERTILDIDEENSGLTVASKKLNILNNTVSYATILYQKTKEKKYAEKAFEYAEKSKMQLLLIRTIQKSNLRKTELPDILIQKEEELNREISKIENLITLNQTRGFNFNDKYIENLALLYDQRDELIDMLEKNYPSYYKAKYDFNVVGLKQVQKMLKDNEVILEYQVLNTELITFIISRNKFDINYQTISKVMFENIKVFTDAISSDPTYSDYNKEFNTITSSSFYLYKKLIAPFYDNIKDKHLIIIPHSELTQVPFELLISELPDYKYSDYRKLKYLIKSITVSYAYSANLLIESNQHKKYGKRTGIFLPDYQNNIVKNELLYLEGAVNEAERIKKISHGKLYKNGDASEGSFKANAKKFKILHIASHTELNESSPLLSNIIMSQTTDTNDDGKLYAYEISQLDLNAQLVVLSGCNTGSGLLRKSEGLISLARSFFYTGVRSIAYTLWPVADNAASDLIEKFYIHIKKGDDLDVAMKEAKLEFLMNSDPVKTHPYYWANYMIVGNTDYIVLTRYHLWQKIFLSTTIVILVFFIYKKFRA